MRFRPSMCNNLHKVLLVCQTSAGLKNPPSKCNIGNVDKFLLCSLPHIRLDVRGTKHLSEAKRGSVPKRARSVSLATEEVSDSEQQF